MRAAHAGTLQLAAMQPLVSDAHKPADWRGDEVPRAAHVVRAGHGRSCTSARRRHADTQQHGPPRVNQTIHRVRQLVEPAAVDIERRTYKQFLNDKYSTNSPSQSESSNVKLCTESFFFRI